MLDKLRARTSNEEGFTLVELLVVMLIIGILAAIAIPSFFAQRDKATDSDAKSGARTAQTAIETYATENGGKYTGADATDLAGIESTLTEWTSKAPPALVVDSAADKAYKLTVTSETGNTFSIERADTGVTTLSCTGTSGGCNGGNW